MIIKELHLIAFGKFHDKVITFEDGLNLVAGENEAGKSTVHKFIEGMFFGFFKPYSKNKIYTPDYDRFLPWVGTEYKGAIVYETSGRLYRLERNFLKGKEWVKLYDHKTGEDLTWSLDYDYTAKMPKANLHLNITPVMFRNTASISQLGNPTGEELTREIGDLFVNATGTYSAGISLNKALDILKKNKDGLGTKRRSKSPYGRDVKELEELKAQRDKIEEEIRQNKQKYIAAGELARELEILNEQKDNIISLRDNISYVKAVNKYERYLSVNEEAIRLKEEIENGPLITADTENRFREAAGNISSAEEKIKSAEENFNISQVQYNALKDSYDLLMNTVADYDFSEVAVDEEIFTKKSEQLSQHKQKQSEETVGPEVYRRYKSLQKKENNFSKFSLISFVLAVICAPLAMFVDSRFMYILAFFTALCASFSGIWLSSKSKRKAIEPEYERYDTLMSRTTNLMLMCEIDIDELTKKYSCKDARELLELFMYLRETKDRLEGLEKDMAEAVGNINKYKDEIETNEEIVKTNTDIIDGIYSSIGCSSSENFYEILERSKNVAVAHAKYNSLLERIDEILLGEDVEELRKKYETAINMNLSHGPDNEEDISRELDSINEAILHATKKEGELLGEVARSEENMASLSLISEKISALEDAIEDYENEIKAYDIAISEIGELSKEIRSTFSEEFNSFISLTVSDITNKKYSDVIVTEDLKMMVRDKELGTLVDMNSLSGGTIDQFYFAMRFAIMDLVLTEKNIPVFLDDCFTQYDENRLYNVLKFILKRSIYKQIIIFTCRSQEEEALSAMNANYNYIRM